MIDEKGRYVVDPKYLTKIAFDEIKEGDVIRCAFPHDHWDYRFISIVQPHSTIGIWRKARGGDVGGCAISSNTTWRLERVEPPAVNYLRAYYNEVEIVNHALHCLVLFRYGGRYDTREITAVGDDLWFQVASEIRAMKARFGELDIVSISHTFIPLDLPQKF